MRELYEQFRVLENFYICGTLIDSTDTEISGFDDDRHRSDVFYWPVTTRSFYRGWMEYMELQADGWDDYFETWNKDTEFDVGLFKKVGVPTGRYTSRSYRLWVLKICAERDPYYQFEIDCQLEADSEYGIFRFND
jgi:hypothetical protein